MNSQVKNDYTSRYQDAEQTEEERPEEHICICPLAQIASLCSVPSPLEIARFPRNVGFFFSKYNREMKERVKAMNFVSFVCLLVCF